MCIFSLSFCCWYQCYWCWRRLPFILTHVDFSNFYFFIFALVLGSFFSFLCCFGFWCCFFGFVSNYFAGSAAVVVVVAVFVFVMSCCCWCFCLYFLLLFITAHFVISHDMLFVVVLRAILFSLREPWSNRLIIMSIQTMFISLYFGLSLSGIILPSLYLVFSKAIQYIWRNKMTIISNWSTNKIQASFYVSYVRCFYHRYY